MTAKDKTILVVDDDSDYLLQLRMRLKAAGYEVITADGQQHALEVLEKQMPDLAVVDLMMEHPDSGFVVCHHIKKRDPAVPVILVTGLTSETGMEFDAETDEERSWVKADVVLDKPIRFEQLQREMERLMRGA